MTSSGPRHQNTTVNCPQHRPSAPSSTSSSANSRQPRNDTVVCGYKKCGHPGHMTKNCNRHKKDAQANLLPKSKSSTSQPPAPARPQYPAHANMATAMIETLPNDSPSTSEGKSLPLPISSFAVSFSDHHLSQNDDALSPLALALEGIEGNGFSAFAHLYTLPSIATFVTTHMSSNESLRICADLYHRCASTAPTLQRSAFCFMATLDSCLQSESLKFTPRLCAQVANIFNALLDSGTTHHIVRSCAAFCSQYNVAGALPIKTANCGYLTTYAVGDVSFDVLYKGQQVQLTLHDCLHAPDAPIDLISVC